MNNSKKALSNLENVFGFMWTEPIDKTLMRMRVVHIITLLVLYSWLDVLMGKVLSLTAQEASVELVALYLTNFVTLVTLFMKSVSEIRKD